MANENLPNIVNTLSDGNLEAAVAVDLGDSLLIIGTSQKGPINQPVAITSPAEAEEVFGTYTIGNMVRGYIESYYAPGGLKDIRLCRISNGNKASVEIEETSGSDLTDETTNLDSLTIEARDPSDVYNGISVRQEIVDGQVSVVLYNPISGLETVIAYDVDGAVSGSVKNVKELVTAINADTNIGSIAEASNGTLDAEFKLDLVSGDAWINTSGYYVDEAALEVNISSGLLSADSNSDDLTDTADVDPVGTRVTLGNNIDQINEVYELAEYQQSLDSAGKQSITLTHPVEMLTTGVAKALYEVDGGVSGDGTAEYVVVNSTIGTGDGSAVDFEFTAYEAIDSVTLIVYRTTTAGITATMPSGSYTLSDAGGSPGFKANITFSEAPANTSILTVSYTSEKITLIQYDTLSDAIASESRTGYFVAGKKITFGAAQPSDMTIRYPARIVYSDVILEDAATGTIKFPDRTNCPDVTTGTVLGLSYTVLAEWPDLSSARGLIGGSNGTDIDNATKYDLLDDLYEITANYEVDGICLMNTYVDDTKIAYDETTGAQATVNAAFASQFNTFLEGLMDGVNETWGIMGVKPADSNKLADVNTWYTKLSTVSQSDTLRSANIMSVLDAKFVSVVAYEPIFNNMFTNLPYTSTGEASYAGLITKLPPESAPTRKTQSGVSGLRFNLSQSQYNVLTGLRYVTAQTKPGVGVQIVDAPVAAVSTSDWTRLQTFRIMAEAMDVVRRAGEPFIGEGFSAPKKAALNTAILGGLMSMKERGALKNFSFRIEQTPAEEVAGAARIPLILYPANELRRIEVTVSLTNQA